MKKYKPNAGWSNITRANADGSLQSKKRRNQIDHEEREAQKLRDYGYEVYSPTVVCDRVAVKDGKVFFIEFKKPGQGLRPGQKLVSELVPDMYVVVYGV